MQTSNFPHLSDAIRSAATELGLSGIVEVFDYGRDREGLIPLWVGEGDLPTADFIIDACKASLARGETFYGHQRGLPDLRAAIAAYMTRVYGHAAEGGPFSPERFFVTIGGMQALELAMRMVAGPGDEVIVPSPAWPNYQGAITMTGARTVFAPMKFGARWSLDMEAIERAATPATRAIGFNSPGNPTGYVATREELVALLEFARRRDIWIIADEIYGRLVYGGERTPSFHDVRTPDDKILFVQTMSKNWAMTGWRVGWLEAPPRLGGVIENLIQYTSSGVPNFIQRAAIAALDHGEDFLRDQIERCRRSRDILTAGLAATGRISFATVDAAFYVFCTVDGEPDSRALAFRLIDEAGVGVAPGSAFGPGGEGFLRLCFASSPDRIAEATRRLVEALRRR